MKKLILTGLGVLILLALVATIGVRMLLSAERVRAALESQASETLGMPVSVGSAAVQLAKAAGAMKASLFGAAQLFNALPASAARAFGQLQEKQEA